MPECLAATQESREVVKAALDLPDVRPGRDTQLILAPDAERDRPLARFRF